MTPTSVPDAEPPMDPTVQMVLDLAPLLMRWERDLLLSLETPLSLRQYWLLERVADGEVSASELSRVWAISRAAVAQNLRSMERRNLVVVSPDPDDKRRQVLGLTPEGRQALAGAQQALSDWHVAVHRTVAAEDGDLAQRFYRASETLRASWKAWSSSGAGTPLDHLHVLGTPERREAR